MELNDAEITFDLVDGKYVIEDVTDYAGQSINTDYIAIVFQITSPSGLVIHNNPDYDNPDIEATETFDTISIASSSNGVPLSGTHTIIMRTRFDNGVDDPTFFEKTYSLNYNFVVPTVTQLVTIDYYSPLIKSQDTTNYLVNLVTPTITRNHRIIYPAAAQAADVVSTGAIVQTQTFYSIDGGLEYTFRLISTLSYEYNTGNPLTSYFVDVIIEGQEVRIIESPQDVCNIYCALKAAQKRYEAAKYTNAANLANVSRTFFGMVGLSQMIMYAYRCGKLNDIQAYMKMLLELGQATDDCCCGDGTTPALVVGIGGFGSATIVEAGTGINVVFDGTDTYTVSIDPSILEMLENGGFDITSDGGTITVTSSVDNDGLTTFNIEVANPLSMLSVRPSILFSGVALPSVAATMDVITHRLYGNIFEQPVITGGSEFIQLDPSIADLPAYLNSPVQFLISNFVASGTPTVFLSAEVVGYQNLADAPLAEFRDIKCEITAIDGNSFYLRMVRCDGTPHTGASIATPNPIVVTLNIQITS